MPSRVWEFEWPISCCGPFRGIAIEEPDGRIRLVWAEAGCGGPYGGIYEVVVERDDPRLVWEDEEDELAYYDPSGGNLIGSATWQEAENFLNKIINNCHAD